LILNGKEFTILLCNFFKITIFTPEYIIIIEENK